MRKRLSLLLEDKPPPVHVPYALERQVRTLQADESMLKRK